MIGGLGEIALNLSPRFRRRADRVMIGFYLGRIGYWEACRRLKRLEGLVKGEQGWPRVWLGGVVCVML